jgi:hypothetical protein
LPEPEPMFLPPGADPSANGNGNGTYPQPQPVESE